MTFRQHKNAACSSAGNIATQLLLPFLILSATAARATAAHFGVNAAPAPPDLPPVFENEPVLHQETFTLRHVYHHGTNRYPALHRKYDVLQSDVISERPRIFMSGEDTGSGVEEIPELRLRSRPGKIERLIDRRPSVVDPMVAAAREQGFVTPLDASAWTMDEIPVPDVTDKSTILTLAYMSANAYLQDKLQPDWQEVGGPYNRSADFGWQGDGLRGHVFTDSTNSTVVIGLKGTSMAYFDGEGTTSNDKLNDNLFFSCCCAQQGQWTFHQVCDCATGTLTCNNTCVRKALFSEDRYYHAGRELFANVTSLYPNANIWLTGHSLGGAVSSLLAMTYGIPAVTFEAVPEALPAGRIGLPVPPSADDPDHPQTWANTAVYHVGHTADPVYMGTCNGPTASCTYFGYAMESECHAGYECSYDVVKDLGWRAGIGTHRIGSVIHDVIMKYDKVAECKLTPECRDCSQWKMYWSNSSTTTTSASYSPTSASNTGTRSATCQTPGWWGCLDKTTTTTPTATSSSSTSTCKTPGWFGCLDKTTSTISTITMPTTAETSSSSSTTCKTPAKFWGCLDKTTTSTKPTSSATPGHSLKRPEATMTPPLSTTAASVSTPSALNPQGTSSSCQSRNWLGMCTMWLQSDGEDVVDEL